MLFFDKLRLTKNYKITSTFDNGTKINLNLDDWIQKQIFYFGRYEIEKRETVFWQKIIQKNDVILDIGANIGYYSLMASKRIGEKGKIFAFEPVSNTYKKLQDNIYLNNFTNIRSENLAVSNSESEIELFVADEMSTGSSSIAMHVNFSGIKEKVKTIEIDKYCKLNKIEKLDLVKIDVEGCEPMVIEGMNHTMISKKPLILIEVLDERLNKINSSKEKLYELFNKADYEAYEIIDNNSLKKISKPKEGGLIVFKHRNKNFPDNINNPEFNPS